MAGIEALCGFSGELCDEQVPMGCGIQDQELGAIRPCLIANMLVLSGAHAALKELNDSKVSLSAPESPDAHTRLVRFIIKTKKETTELGYYGVKNGQVIKELSSSG